ncbi:hypothetical protein BSKO_07942 [Bryopsis sp. KO-2023]|nr:hypothetical protein BSKO_07942 [Bryopsis sp. KO-2023]
MTEKTDAGRRKEESAELKRVCAGQETGNQLLEDRLIASKMERAWEKALSGDFEYFQQLEAADLSRMCEAKDEDGRSLFHCGVASGNGDLVQFLYSKGKQDVLNNQDDEGWSPLHSCVSCGHLVVVKMLISLGCTIDILTSSKRTPLHYAASKGHHEIIGVLLEAGASVKVKDITGSTPLHRAASVGKLAAVRVLVEKGNAPLEATDNEGQTPLFLAVSCRNRGVAIFLAGKGANINASTMEGESPIDVSGDFKASLMAAVNGEVDIDELQ